MSAAGWTGCWGAAGVGCPGPPSPPSPPGPPILPGPPPPWHLRMHWSEACSCWGVVVPLGADWVLVIAVLAYVMV